MKNTNMKYAKDYKCLDCGKQAEVFFPIVDPDIEPSPYCRECAEKRKAKLMQELYNVREKLRNKNGRR